jgi:SCA7, zinc-binding domain
MVRINRKNCQNWIDFCNSARCGLWFQRIEEVIDIETVPVLTPLNLGKDPTRLHNHQNKSRRSQSNEIQDEDEDVRLYKRVRILQKKYKDKPKSSAVFSYTKSGVGSRKSRHSRPVDVERQCAVSMPNGVPCARSLTCKSHSMGAKRAIPGRSLPYNMLLVAYQKKKQAKQPSTSYITLLILHHLLICVKQRLLLMPMHNQNIGMPLNMSLSIIPLGSMLDGKEEHLRLTQCQPSLALNHNSCQ